MKKSKLFSILVLSVGMLLVGCNSASSSNSSSNSSSETSDEITTSPSNTSENQKTLTFEKALCVATENEGELHINAVNKLDEGTIYYVLSTLDKEYQVKDIVDGTLEEFIDHKSTTEKSLDFLVKDLTPGATYYAYFLIKDEDNYSSIIKRSATTYKIPLDMGEGTAENPYKIYNIEDLEAVGTGTHPSYNLDFSKTSYYQLVEDIDLAEKYGEGKESWTPLALSTGGVFDGNNHKISNLYIYNMEGSENLGLFSQIDKGATLKNLTLENVSITAKGCNESPRTVDENNNPTSTNVAAEKLQKINYVSSSSPYIGALTADVKGEVDNCHVLNAKIDVDGTRVGGITGRLYSDNGTASKIRNSSFEGDIKAIGRVGGIVGLVDAKKNEFDNYEQAIIENVTFKGNIVTENKPLYDETTSEEKTLLGIVTSEYVGGIAGYYRTCTLKNAVVEGSIYAYRHVGGILGFQQYAKPAEVGNHYSDMKNVIFKGEVHAGENITNLGPIVGNRSTSNIPDTSTDKLEVAVLNAYYVSSSKFYSLENEITFDNLNKNSKFGEAVLDTDLNENWYKEKMPDLDLENVFSLSEDNYPVLHKETKQ